MLNYFEPHEFECKCGCGLGFDSMNKDLLIKLDEARRIAGVPFTLWSAMRCPEHNEREGGSATSSHLIGFAVDIEARDDHHKFRIVRSLIAVGFNRIGIAGSFIHVDNDPAKNSSRMWSY